ncbi:MAG: hypothetical protein Q8P73_03955 [bacterium]|nr:hypothetical protein [bacterium]
MAKKKSGNSIKKTTGAQGSKLATKSDYIKMKNEIIRHFYEVAEKIHQDVAGANKGEISFLANKQDDHEKRISRVEQKVFGG